MSKPFSACQNVLKLTYSNLEFQNISRGKPLDSPLSGRGNRKGRLGGEKKKGRESVEGKEGKGKG